MRFIDLSHPFTETMPSFPGDPPAGLARVADFARGDDFTLSALTTGLHAGTHLDAPLHMIRGGAGISELPLAGFFGRGVLVDARGLASIDSRTLAGIPLAPGDMVLIWTGFSDRYRTPDYYRDYPEIAADFASRLVEAKVRLLGLDTPSPDRAPYPIHHRLLGHGILLAENLTNLASLADCPAFEIIALPMNLAAEAAPARVLARLT
jgi:kynurenine formamidase